MLVTCDDGLRQYLGQVLTQLSGDYVQLHLNVENDFDGDFPKPTPLRVQSG